MTWASLLTRRARPSEADLAVLRLLLDSEELVSDSVQLPLMSGRLLRGCASPRCRVGWL